MCGTAEHARTPWFYKGRERQSKQGRLKVVGSTDVCPHAKFMVRVPSRDAEKRLVLDPVVGRLYPGCAACVPLLYWREPRGLVPRSQETTGMRPSVGVIRILLFVIGLCAAARASAQPSVVLTAAEAVERGLAQSHGVTAAQADVAAARAVVRQVRAGLLPTVVSQGTYTRLSDNIPEITVDFPALPGQPAADYTLAPIELNQYYGQVSVEQPVFTGFRLANSLQSARHSAEAAALTAEQAEVEAAFLVRQAYWQLYRALAVQDATESALRGVEAHLSDVRNRRAAGAALASEVLTAQTRRAEVRLDSVGAANAVRVARLELNRLVGLPLDTHTRPGDSIAVAPPGPDLDVLVQRALARQPLLEAIDEERRALEATVDAARSTWYPDVYLSGRYVYARPNPNFFLERDAFKGTWEAGVSARWTVWNGGYRGGEAEEARARLREAEARGRQAREEIVVGVHRQYLEVQRARAAVDVAGQSIDEAREALRVLRERYRAGAALSSDVLDAEAAARRATVRHAQALADYAVARAALLRVIGRVQENASLRVP